MLLKNCNIDVLSVTETQLNQRIEEKEVEIDGYKLQRSDREHKKVEGCVVYYREDLDVVPRPDLKNNEMEAILVEIICKSQRLLIGTVYRPPDNNEFYDIYDEVISKIWQTRSNLLIMGDLNSDLLHKNAHTDLGMQGKNCREF